MSETEPTPRATKVVAGALVGGLAAATAGQRLSPWVLASQTHTIIAVAAGAVILGAIVFAATKPRPR